MADIKSAREIARQKIAGLDEATDEDRRRWKYVPEGEKLAVKCLNKKVDITQELCGFEKKAAKYVKMGIESVLLANISLPKNETLKNKNEKIIDCFKRIKKDKTALEAVICSIRQLYEHYEGQGEQQRKQIYDDLKVEFGEKLRQAVQKQLGTVDGVDMDVEKLAKFQEEWQRTLVELDLQYTKLLDEYKQQLKTID